MTFMRLPAPAFAYLSFIVSFSVALFALIALLAAPISAAPPRQIDYRAFLTDRSGVPVTGTVTLGVALYESGAGGNVLWDQQSTVTVVDGNVQVTLDGSGANPFPAGLFSKTLHLGLTVGADPEMDPRVLLTSVPYALEAANSGLLEGLTAADVLAAGGSGGGSCGRTRYFFDGAQSSSVQDPLTLACVTTAETFTCPGATELVGAMPTEYLSTATNRFMRFQGLSRTQTTWTNNSVTTVCKTLHIATEGSSTPPVAYVFHAIELTCCR